MMPAGLDKSSGNMAFNLVSEKEVGKGEGKVRKTTWAAGRLSVPLPGFTSSESY
jgi:hypothetical protein